ncbi:unnamed protein product, partial [Ectocarpus fasciculatus]
PAPAALGFDDAQPSALPSPVITAPAVVVAPLGSPEAPSPVVGESPASSPDATLAPSASTPTGDTTPAPAALGFDDAQPSALPPPITAAPVVVVAPFGSPEAPVPTPSDGGDEDDCTPCPGPAPSPAPIASTAETPAPAAGFTPFGTGGTVSPTAKETVTVEEDVTYSPAPHVSAAYGTGTPAEADFAGLSTPAPVNPAAPAADAGVDVEIDVDTGADGDGTNVDTTSDCAACSNLSEVQMLALAAYPGGAKRVVCDPDCLDGVDVLDCDYFGLGQICRGCGDCDGCEACP